MGDFGFDSRLVPDWMAHQDQLAQQQAELQLRRQQEARQAQNDAIANQQRQASLADMLYQQGRQRTLADLISRGVAPDQAYQQVGDPQGMMDAQKADIAQQQARDAFLKVHGDLLRSQAATLKTPEQIDKWSAGLPDWAKKQYGVPDQDAADQEKTDWAKSFIASGIAPEKREELEIRREGENKRRFQPDSFGRVIDTWTGQVAGDPLSKGGGGGPMGAAELGQDGLDILVNKAVRDGEMPRFGSGALGMKQRNDFLNRMAQTYGKDVDLATAHAQYRANMHNLQEATAQAGAQDVKEGKALGDIKILQGTMGKIWGSDIQALNAAGRTLQDWARNPDYAAYQTALEATLPSINAVLNSGQMSVGARDEVKGLLKEKDNPAAMNKALGILIQDMSRSTEATHKRISNARKAISAKPGSTPGDEGSANAHPQDSQAIDWARRNPNDPLAAQILRANGVQ